MINHNLYLLTILLITCFHVSRCGMTIEDISHICHTPNGRMGRCSSADNCHHHAGCDRKASTSPCTNGQGDPPYVCCVFGKDIALPEDDIPVASRYSSGPPLTTSSEHRSMALESRHGSVLFSDENGHYNISSPIAATPEKQDHYTKLDLFPKPPVCGPMSLGDKIHGGREAELGEFPWLVNLEYRLESGELDIFCAGSILNQRYVLTAGHCVQGEIETEIGKLESLRVGDHNIAEDTDCDDLGCLDPFQRFGIIETVVHEEYLFTIKRKIFNDIALLKTDRNIIYSYSVAPICLPDVMPSLEPPVGGARLTVAGWGHNGTVFTDEKRIVDVPYVENSVCSLRVVPSKLCAGGVVGKDSCSGDSGGSLARRTGQGWIIEGIVSYGRACGTHYPAIYTRIRYFLPWIHKEIERREIINMRAQIFSHAHSNPPIKNSIIGLIFIFLWISA